MGYFYFDIGTCPLNKEEYLSRDEEGRKKLLNPIDSRIVAIGLRAAGKDTAILQEEDEKKMIDSFWHEFGAFRKLNPFGKLTGFNVKDFDLPFLVTRSFITGSVVVPFTLKETIDLRESIAAFTFRHTRGKMKEFAELIGIKTIEGFDGADVAEAHWAGEHAKIAEYLRKDIEIIEAMAKRLVALKIDRIQKW